VKTTVVLGISCLFAAAAAKPFVEDDQVQRLSSWAHFRSYPYAAKAQAAFANGNAAEAARLFAHALARNQDNPLYSRGLLMAWQNAMLPVQARTNPDVVDLTKKPHTVTAAALPLYAVRHMVPRHQAARQQQTAWRGPVVNFTSGTVMVAFQETQSAMPGNTKILPGNIMAAAGTMPQPPVQVPIPLAMPRTVPAKLPAKSAARFSVAAGASIRANPLPVPVRGATEFGGSQTGAEVRWRVNNDASTPLHIAASTFVGVDDRFSMIGASTQAAIGVRYKPSGKINAVLGLDRMVKLGSQSRNAFALRLMADAGHNYDAPLAQNHWLHWHAGVDSALIGAKSRDVFASGEARAGMGFRLADQWSLTPYVAAHALLQKTTATTTLVEMGPGIWLRGNLSETSRLDIRVGYRINVAGNTATKDGVVAQVAVGF
jgi:Bacteriophage N adsorption protein A C-term